MSGILIPDCIPFQRHQKLELLYYGEKMKKYFIADFVCYEKILLELKSSPFIHKNNFDQLINYLKATKLEVGILANFGVSSLQYKRCIKHCPIRVINFNPRNMYSKSV